MGRQATRRRYWCGGNREPGQDVFFIEALDERLWKPGSAEDWDTCWYTGMPDPEVFERLDATRSINHIPGNNALTIKSYLARTLARHRALVADRPQAPAMDFFPATFVMPEDYRALQQAAAAAPERRWLLKPANSSRGRGIRLLADVAAAPREPGWIVQEYVARPHLHRGRKYVLRLYVLITSVDPLVAWLYEEGFQKLASAPYDPEDATNIYAHLTNPDVNETNTAAPPPVAFVGTGRYRQWLRAQGLDDAALFARIEEALRMTVIAARASMRRRLAQVSADTRGCYELLGIDCLIDADLRPWIMECNLSPSLEVCAAPADGGDFEAATKRRLVADMVALLGLNEVPDPARLSAPPERRITEGFARQTACSGGFRLLCPGPDPAAYLASLPAPGAGDIHLLTHLHGRPPDLVFAPTEVAELYEDDRLLLYAAGEGRVIALNAVASLVWLRMAAGEPIGRIADELAERSATPWATRMSVWTLVDDWAQRGLVRLAGSDPDRAIPRPGSAAATSVPETQERTLPLTVGRRRVRLVLACPAAAGRLAPLFAPLAQASRNRAQAAGRARRTPEVAVLPAPDGYVLATGRQVLTPPQGLDGIALALWEWLRARAGDETELLIPGRLLPLADGRMLLFASRKETGYDAPGLAIAGSRDAHGLVRLDLGPEGGTLTPVPLPLRLSRGAEDGVLLAPATGPVPAPDPVPARDVAAVVVPREGEPVLAPLSSAEAIVLLLAGLRGAEGRPPPAALVEAFDEWLQARPVLGLGVTDLEAAAAALDRAFPLKARRSPPAAMAAQPASEI